MSVSNAVPSSALSRVVGYALEHRDLQTAAAVLPVRILVLSDLGSEITARPVKTKIINADKNKVAEALGASALGADVMEILDNLNSAQFIDVLPINSSLDDASALESEIKNGLGDVWYNIIVNPFGQNANVYQALQKINGYPDESGGMGRWNAIILKPFVAISGTNSTSFTHLPSTDLTNIVGTAPKAFAGVSTISNEAANARIAASYALAAFRQFSTKPYLDIAGRHLEFIVPPTDLDIGAFETFDNRDSAAKNGISTVTIDRAAQAYVIQDFITGYRPQEQSELAKSWRFVRDVFVDFNIAFNYNLLQTRRLLGKVIVSDTEIINADRRSDVVRLEVWRAEVLAFLERMVGMAYVTDLDFSRQNLLVELSGTNPRRLNTQFAYKRTSVVGIASTTAYVGFSFGGIE